MSTKKLISYIRVSTRKQGDSGLGMEAQKAAVEAYAKATGAEIISTFTEIESGKRSDRPELAKALANARRSRATLCIAKLDRLARNIHFVSGLMESGVDFVAVDNPAANKLTVHLLACIAENEAEQISARTVAALKAAKARGTPLGSARPGHWDGRESKRQAGLVKAQAESRRVRREKTIAGVADLLPLMQERRAAGMGFAKVAAALNDAGHRTTRGNNWTPIGVKLAMERAGKQLK